MIKCNNRPLCEVETAPVCDVDRPLCDVDRPLCDVDRPICHVNIPLCNVDGPSCDVELLSFRSVQWLVYCVSSSLC